jgi:hypothetical protein
MDAAEEASARAAADKLLAESLNRQASQILQATQQAQSAASSYADTANAATPSPAAAAAQAVADPVAAEPQSTGSTQPWVATQTSVASQAPVAPPTPPAAQTPPAAVQTPAAAQSADPMQPTTAPAPMQTAMAQPKSETSVQKSDIPSPPPPPVETPRVEAPPAPTISAEENRRLLAKAASMIQQGDIASARLVLDRLTRFGDARAAFALAETFDPKMLAQWNVRGIRPDPTRAKTYYTQAARAGIGAARDRLSELGN